MFKFASTNRSQKNAFRVSDSYVLRIPFLSNFYDDYMLGLKKKQDSLAEWSKVLASGASPQGRGLEPRSCQFSAAKLCGRVPDH